MSWRDTAGPVRMQRVAIVASCPQLRAALVRVADAGTVELDHSPRPGDAAPGEAGRRLARMSERAAAPRLTEQAPDRDCPPRI